MSRCRRSVLAVACALALAAPALAAGKPSLRPLDRKVNAIRNQIRNASARYENKVRGPIGQVDDPGYEATPARTCCAPNLERLNGQVAAVSVLLDELDAAYSEAPNIEGLKAVDQLRAQLEVLAVGLDAFATAPSRSDATGALGNLHRAYLLLYEVHEELLDCCALPGDLDKTGDKNKKGKAADGKPAGRSKQG